MIRRVPHFAVAALGSLALVTSAFAQASVTPVPVNVDSLAPAPTTDSADSAAAVSVAPAPAAGLEYRVVFGVSGSLRVAMLANDQAVAAPLLAAVGAGKGRPRWIPAYGTVRRGLLGEPVFRGEVIAPTTAGMWWLEPGEASYIASSRSLTFITTVPFSEKQRGHLNGYHIGTYPTEGAGRTDAYAPPTAFIEVTPENQDVFVSQHFRLRQFLTKDQFDVWPKYVALNLRLIDKLELVIQELNLMGSRALAVHVMSGFRTPQYNGPGGDGRAALSRHMYGDAADIWVDGDDDGLIDDLNGDGRNDIHDAELLVRAVERVEQKYPDLTGGAGLYEANHAHGPFVHVDVRGSRVRW
jgi:uncharacterized protein YcbK (DUF882 family)